MKTGCLALKRTALTVFAMLAVFINPGALAQQYPTRFITLVVAFPPGSAPDVVARLFAPSFESAMGQKIVIENRSGAGGYSAGEYVARASADGYTLLYSSTS